MKRLLIAAFLVITSVTVFSLTTKTNGACAEKVCCKEKKQPNKTSEGSKADYIFWQPVNRLILISK